MNNFIHLFIDRRNKQQKNDSWDAFGGSFCQFTLYKENRDTMEAINFMGKLLKCGFHQLFQKLFC